MSKKKQVEEVVEAANVVELPSGPSVTIEGIHAKIARQMYFHVEGTTLTICVLQLQNGMYIVGESACVSPENYDELKGQQIAWENAVDKIWQLEGYLLREKLYNEQLDGATP